MIPAMSTAMTLGTPKPLNAKGTRRISTRTSRITTKNSISIPIVPYYIYKEFIFSLSIISVIAAYTTIL